MLEDLIKTTVNLVHPPWNYVLGVVALLILNADKIINFRDSWRSSHSELKKLEREKLYLEVEKLRRELQISPTPEYVPTVVPDLARDLGSIRIDSRSPGLAGVIDAPPLTPSKPKRTGLVRRFVNDNPRLGLPLMVIAQILLVPVIGFLGLATLGIVIVGFTETEIGVGGGIMLGIVYGALTWLSYRGFRSAGSIRRAAAN